MPSSPASWARTTCCPAPIEARDDEDCRVRLACGPVVAAQAVDCGGPGEDCLVAVRPERVAVAGVTASDLGEGALPAVLHEAIFLGDHVRLRLALGDGGEILAKRPAGIGAPAGTRRAGGDRLAGGRGLRVSPAGRVAASGCAAGDPGAGAGAAPTPAARDERLPSWMAGQGSGRCPHVKKRNAAQ